MFKGPDALNIPLRLEQLLDVVVQEVLLDVLVPRHQLHVVNLQCFKSKTDWSTLIGRGPSRLCSDWLDSDVADASSLMP